MAWDFNGVDGNNLKYTQANVYGSLGVVTFGAWFRRNAAAPASWGRVLHKSNGSTGDDFALTIRFSVQEFAVRVTTGASVTLDTNVVSSLNVWQHFLGLYDGTEITCYVDGVGLPTSIAQTGTVQDSSSDIAVGGHLHGADRSLDCQVAEAAIWNVVLTGDEIRALAKRVSPGSIRPSALLFYPDLIRAERDRLGQAATVNGSPVVFDHPPMIHRRRRTISFPSTTTVSGISDSRNLIISGKNNSQLFEDLFIRGHQLSMSSLDVFIEGNEFVSTSGDLIILGNQEVSNSKDLFIQGEITTSGSSNLVIFTKDTIQTSGDLFITGTIDSSGNIDHFIKGKDTESNTSDLFIEGFSEEFVSNSADLFLIGIDDINTLEDLFIQGSDKTTLSTTLFVGGLDKSSSVVSPTLFINGHNNNILSADLFTRGIGQNTKTTDLFIQGFLASGHNETSTLFIAGLNLISDNVELLILSNDSVSGANNLFMSGAVLLASVSGSHDLLVPGKDSSQFSGDLLIFGNDIVSLSGNMYISGPIALPSQINLFIFGPSGVVAIDSSFDLFINGIEPKPALICPTLDPTASIQIKDSLIKIYQSRIDALINQLGKNVQLEFDPIRASCPNCTFDNIRKRSTGIYIPGGPRPFSRGRQCPWCKGRGYEETTVTKCIKCLIKWNPEDVENFGISIGKRNGIVRFKTFLTEADDLIRAKTAIANRDIEDQLKLRVRLIQGPIPVGLRERRYCISFWELM